MTVTITYRPSPWIRIRGASTAAAALAALVVGLALAQLPATRPPPSTPDAAAFDARRAIAQLRVIAADSHFVGTAAHDQVRAYIHDQAAQLPRVHAALQTTVASFRAWDPIAVAGVTNVVARLPGTSGDRAVLVVAHYDSVPTGPGAADDGAAVAAMLEVLRLAARDPAPRNDLVFLFTDAEEVGSVGAAGYLAALSPAERARIAVVLNFDARGDRGPAVMFETSPDNGWLIDQYAAAAPRPVASSLISAAYGLLDNGTDFSVFRAAGLPGLNFAFIGGVDAYHTGRETVDDLDLAGVQHQGEQMLGLVRRLGGAELDHVAAPPVVYFDLIGRCVIRYGAWLAWLLAAVCGLGAALVVAWGVRTGRLRPWRCAAAAGIATASVVVAALGAHGLWAVVTGLEPRYTQVPGAASPGYFAGVLLLAGAAALQGARVCGRSIAPVEAAVGALVPWTGLAVASAFTLPGTTYFFQWPQLCGLALLTVLLHADRARPDRARPGESDSSRLTVLLHADRARAPRWLLPAASLLVLPSTLLIVPFARLLFDAFGMAGIGLVAALWALWLSLLAPFLGRALGPAAPWVVRLAAIAGVVVLGLAFAGRDFDRAHPTFDSLAYLLDADQQRASWVSADPRLDAWTGSTLGAAAHPQALEPDFPDVRWTGYVAAAPVLDLPAPDVVVRGDTRQGSERRLVLRLVPRAQGSMLELQISPARLLGLDVAGLHQDSAALRGHRGRVLLQLWTPDPAGTELELRVPDGVPLTLHLSEVQYGSRATQRVFPTPRPSDVLPYPFGWFSDAIRVSRTVRL
ncbi:MAG TPA: M20/M25/M40 family metallo-hydrolase [Kofleriaceae bacterium]|nr:M20/M25/M40 family metallo-hydrolase [Kofleriaceae bacterium]